MLGLVKSSIGTKFTGQFGDLIAVSILFETLTASCPHIDFFYYVQFMDFLTPYVALLRTLLSMLLQQQVLT